MLDEILRDGFSSANRHLGLVFLDLLWKAVWLVLTLIALLLVGAWFGSQLQAIEWQDTGIPLINGWLAASLLRQFWMASAGNLALALFLVVCFSALLWLCLEASFRFRILHAVASSSPSPDIEKGSGLQPAVGSTVKIFLATRLVKTMALFGAAAPLLLISLGRYLGTPPSEWAAAWLEVRGPAIVSIVIIFTFAFLLTVLDTLIRSGATELLGTDLIRVTGVIGTLVLFEAMIGVSLLIVIFAGFLNVARADEAVRMLLFSVLSAIVLTMLHSYLLLVRFSAVGIMRRNVVDV